MSLLHSPDLSYFLYAHGCETAEEQSLELVYNLDHYFDGTYPTDLLVFVLRELNPDVLLQADESTGRRDWPWLSDADLDTVGQDCRRYLGHAEPGHERELDELLVNLRLAPFEPVIRGESFRSAA